MSWDGECNGQQEPLPVHLSICVLQVRQPLSVSTGSAVRANRKALLAWRGAITRTRTASVRFCRPKRVKCLTNGGGFIRTFIPSHTISNMETIIATLLIIYALVKRARNIFDKLICSHVQSFDTGHHIDCSQTNPLIAHATYETTALPL